MKAVLVHLPGVPWHCLMQDCAAPLLPAFLKLIESGASGTCKAIGPHPLMDGVIATGRAPHPNGLLTRHEARADGFGVDLASACQPGAPAVWQYLDAAGARCASVNMLATNFGVLEQGIVVSDAFCEIRAAHFDGWGIPPGAIFPLRLAPALADFRVHPEDLEVDHVAPFLVDEAPDQGQAKPRVVAKILAENSTAHAAATYLLEQERVDFCAVRYPALAQLRTAFASAAERPPGKGAAWGFLRLLDAFLSRLIELAGPGAAFFVTGGTEDAPFWIACGPGVAEDVLWPRNTSLYDLAPSLLALFGFTAGNLSGTVPAGIFANRQTVSVPLLSTMMPERQSAAARRALENLAASGMPRLGPSKSQQEMLDKQRFRQHFALAECARLDGRHADAMAMYVAALAVFPEDARALSGLRHSVRLHDAARKAV